jgi:hypothetical protein
MFIIFSIVSVKVLVFKLKIIGLNTLHCGQPFTVYITSENEPLSLTLIDFVAKNSFIQRSIRPLTPILPKYEIADPIHS